MSGVVGPADPLRVGVVGAGIRGELLGTSLHQHPGVRVVGVADLDEGLATRLAHVLDAAPFAGHDAMLGADLGLDAVVVATPDPAHRDAVVAVAESGHHLLVEKPLATDVDDARAMVDAVERAGVRCMVGFENRWNPRFLSAKALVDDGALGTVLTQVAHLHDTLFVPTRMLSWAARSSPAWFLMPHTLDLALWLSGRDVVQVYATGVRGHLASSGVDTWDAVTAQLTTDDGGTITLHSSWVLPESYPSVFDLRFELVGTRGALRVDGADQGVVHYGDRAGWPQHGTWTASDGRLAGFPVDMAYAFADHLRGTVPSVPDHRDGLRVTEVIDAIGSSLTTAAPVAVDHAHPRSTS